MREGWETARLIMGNCSFSEESPNTREQDAG